MVLFGGRSAEHDISRVSASHVLRAVDPDRYDVVPVAITRNGDWVLARSAAQLLAGGRSADLPAAIAADGPDVDPLAVLSGDTAAQSDTQPAARSAVTTVVLPILHGPNGEDGTVQGLLELAGLPYVGAGVLGSAVAMDKVMAKTVLDAHAIPQPRWRAVAVSELAAPGLAEGLHTELGPTVFVKPANMGSSIGVNRAADPDAIRAALREAAAYDELLVVEEAVVARELECGVLGNDSPRASVVGEIIPAAAFYDFDDKYTDGAAKTVVPADLTDDVSESVRSLALRTFSALRAEGMARVDVFWEEHQGGRPGRGPLVNEINTIPGFTPISMYPMLWQASGVGYPQLVDELIRLALERHARRRHRSTGSPPGRGTC